MITVPIPRRMKKLPRDERGYPVPVNVMRDAAGKPQFTINDSAVAARLLADDKCPICGELLAINRWFIGGPLAAYHPRGAYLDMPTHDECAHYALRACPYLAAPSYAKRIDARKVTTGDTTPLLIDYTMMPERPEVFVAVLSRGATYDDSGMQTFHYPVRPYLRVEYWRQGQLVPAAEGAAIVERILSQGLPAALSGRSPARFVRAGR